MAPVMGFAQNYDASSDVGTVVSQMSHRVDLGAVDGPIRYVGDADTL